jgi:hypothetical protein
VKAFVESTFPRIDVDLAGRLEAAFVKCNIAQCFPELRFCAGFP